MKEFAKSQSKEGGKYMKMNRDLHRFLITQRRRYLRH